MMVAAHLGDLKAARACGLRTAFVSRPNEFGPSGKADTAAGKQFDVTVLDLLHLAQKL
jgi:2-haloacid dehalogenase